MSNKFDLLKLENQLCFPLYACSKEVIRKYRPYLDKIDLTYTQYITMMVLWEHKKVSVKEIGSKLFLDSGTLTPVLKNLENKGYIRRKRSKDDERVLYAEITEKGEALKEKSIDIPKEMAKCVNLSDEEALMLYKLLYKLLSGCGE